MYIVYRISHIEFDSGSDDDDDGGGDDDDEDDHDDDGDEDEEGYPWRCPPFGACGRLQGRIAPLTDLGTAVSCGMLHTSCC